VHKLTDHLYAETKYDWANVGAAVTDLGVVMLDCPVRPTDSQHWQKEIRPLSPHGIQYLIATDYHGDHTAGSAFVKDVHRIAPQYVFEEVAKGDNIFSKEIFTKTLRDQGHIDEAEEIENTPIPPPQFCFEESLILHLPPLTFEIYRKGGHSPACSSVYVPEEGVLFAGDVVINGPSAGMRDANAAEWIAGLNWVESLPVETIVPGHGDICGKEVVRRLRDYIEGLKGTMEKVVGEGKTKDEALVDASFEKFFHGDASRGAYWLQQRKDTFRAGLERLYQEVKESSAT
jgi:cyclase